MPNTDVPTEPKSRNFGSCGRPRKVSSPGGAPRASERIEREFEPNAVRRLKADADHDITVDGPVLAAQAIKAGLVDEFQMIVCPVVVGGGKRFLPDGVRLDLELVAERRLRSGVVVLQYAVRG